MFNYMRYLTLYAFHKVTLLVIYIVGIIGYSVLTIMQSKSANTNVQSPSSYITSISTLGVFIPFVLSILFVIFVFIYLFKDGEQDGSELLILTKPITRNKIILSKFIVMVLFSFVYSMSYILIAFLVSFGDKLATYQEQTRYAFSIGVGMFIIMLILGTLISIIGSFMNKVGTLAVGLLITTIFPILSMIVTPVMKGTVDYAPNIGVSSNGYVVTDLSKLDFDKKNTNYNMSSIVNNDPDEIYYVIDNRENNTNKSKYDSYLDNLSYDSFAYVDFWYQWSRFYGMFINEKPTQTNAYKYTKISGDKNIQLSEGSGLKINNSGTVDELLYVYDMYPRNLAEEATKKMTGIAMGPIDGIARMGTIEFFDAWLEKEHAPNVKNIDKFLQVESMQMRLAIVKLIFTKTAINDGTIDNVSFNFSDVQFQKAIEEAKWNNDNVMTQISIIYKHIENKYIKDDKTKMPTTFAYKPDATAVASSEFEYYFIKNGAKLEKFGDYTNTKVKYEFIVLTPFMKTWLIILIWTILGLAFVGFAFWRYKRIDFK